MNRLASRTPEQALSRIRDLTPPRVAAGATRERVLSAIQDLCSDGWPTTTREVADRCHLSVSTVYPHILKLQESGLVQQRGSGRSGIRPVAVVHP